MFRFLTLLTFWMVGSALCYGQAELEMSPHWNADPADNIYQNSELIQLNQDGYPKGWNEEATFASGKAVVLDNPRGTIQLSCPDDGGVTSVSTNIDLPKRVHYVTILTRMRGPSIELGNSETSGAGMVFTISMKNGKQREYPRVEPYYKYGSLRGWKTYRSTIRILPGYTQLNIRAVIEDAKGSFEVDRVLVVPSEPGYQATAEEKQELRAAIRSDDGPAIAKLIGNRPQLLEWRDGTMDNGTPLIHAAWFNSVDVTKELLRLGANMEAFDDSWKNTPLAWCCWWGNPEVAEVLVDAGAQTRHFASMAAKCKTTNRSPRGKPSDFDRIVELINAAQDLNQ